MLAGVGEIRGEGSLTDRTLILPIGCSEPGIHNQRGLESVCCVSMKYVMRLRGLR